MMADSGVIESSGKERRDEEPQRRGDKANVIYSQTSPHDSEKFPESTGEDDVSYVQKEIRIVLIGKTGSGKSSTANTLLGMNYFKSLFSSVSITRKTSSKLSTYKGRDVLLIDTPGLFDTEIPNRVMKKEILKCVALAAPGLHAVVLVTKLGRFTEEEKQNVEEFKKYFGEGLSRYLMIIFTGKDDLDASESTLESYLETADQVLKQVVEECSHRCLTVNNRASEAEKLKFKDDFFALIDDTVKRSGGGCYTNDMLAAAETQMKLAERRIKIELQEHQQREQDEKLKMFRVEQEAKMDELKRKTEEEKRRIEKEKSEMEAKIQHKQFKLEEENKRLLAEAEETKKEMTRREEEMKQKAEEEKRKYEEIRQNELRENALRKLHEETEAARTELKRQAKAERKQRKMEKAEIEKQLQKDQIEMEKEKRQLLAQAKHLEDEKKRMEEQIKKATEAEIRKYEENLQREARKKAREEVEEEESKLDKFIRGLKAPFAWLSNMLN